MTAALVVPSIDPGLAPGVGPAELATHPIYGDRPVLRGRFHQAAALASAPLGAHLIAHTAPAARGAVVAYAVSLTLMFATSACYHRLAQRIAARFWMRRLDHSMILVHIAGATTPVALVGVGGTAGATLTAAVWAGAAVGVALKMTRLTAAGDPAAWTFPALGTCPLLAVPAVAGSAGATAAVLLAATVVTYAAGAVCFARKSPDPIPRVFGYHEVWHAFTIVAATLQFLMLTRLV